MPWYATLPRVEARYYLQYYAGSGDVWIGKTLYRLTTTFTLLFIYIVVCIHDMFLKTFFIIHMNRMPEISNDTYHELAKTDFKRCQAQHQFEWIYMQEYALIFKFIFIFFNYAPN